ncbi:hypothetical protein [Planctomonas psychrotolerans]|uniref:hypothetical protein n=1 Tax=Planctomonas psychrotolerans TaxID=2528712 RepID=UPI001238B6DD|nr:hypothetical protein [Planctomonas psychrotolerans]
MDTGMQDVAGIGAGADHLDAEQHLLHRGWTPCGRGDWAIALESPSGRLAARISPFDPTAPFTAALYREGRTTGWFPQLYLERRLEGGGSLLLMNFLRPLDGAIAAAVLRRLEARDPGIAEAADLVGRMHRRAMSALPWCGPVDDNPSNVMAAADGTPRITDPFYAAGRSLYAAVLDAPIDVARAIPREQRRHILDIPLASSGSWDPVERLRMLEGLARADDELSAEHTGRP